MTDEERADTIRAYIAGIERIKKTTKGKDLTQALERIQLRLHTIMLLYQELQKNGRNDLWEEFREWAEGLAQL